MGTKAHVVQMKTKLDESTCLTVPWYNGVGCMSETHKVYTIGAFCGFFSYAMKARKSLCSPLHL
jgi:hypothetical protein